MTQINQPQIGNLRWFTGWLALGLIVFIQLQSAFLTTAIWLATHHGQDHEIVVHTDGNHLDVRLSHDQTKTPAGYHHDTSLSLITTLFSTHGHDGEDHVLHFNLTETPDQIRSRQNINAAPTAAPSVAIAAISLFLSPLISTKPAAAILPESPPILNAGLLGLRSTVLLV